MRRVIFGNFFDNVEPYENQTVNRKYAPAYIHFSTHARMNSTFCVEDIVFALHIEEENDYHFHLTSSAVLTDHAGRNMLCWGWAETKTHITFIHSEENNLPAKLTVFERPTLEKETISSNIGQRNKIKKFYRIPTNYNSDGFILGNFCPVCIKFHLQNN